MQEIPLCPMCGVPSRCTDDHLWLGGGVIVQSNDREHRMVLIECDNLDPLFKEIEEIIGVPIERIVIETKRRSSRDYLNNLMPVEVKEMIQSKELEIRPLVEAVDLIAHVLGYGDPRIAGVRYEKDDEDYIMQHIGEPYSVPLWCGDLAGSSEAVASRDYEVEYRMISPNVLEVKAWPSPRPPELQARLQHKELTIVDGNIELERCPSCGGPTALSAYRWDVERGVIVMADTGRRVAMLGPAYLEAVFDELERELGEEIPRIIVEAQRRFTRKGLYSAEEIGDEDKFRNLLAVRGFGNLQEMRLNERGLVMRIQNPTLHLLLAGLVQGYFETVTGTESDVDWDLTAGSTLELRVASRSGTG
ncbi:MAG: hypothetical protein JW854_17520 [Actinobacteria bacterium]|nr:hypothetical protein [Actinomycetota bacterium]